MIAVIEGGKPFLYAGYGLTWIVLSAYALFLTVKYRRLKDAGCHCEEVRRTDETISGGTHG